MGNKSKRLSTSAKSPVPTSLVGTASISHSQLYSGPIPPASEMKKYEDIQPGMADRILAIAERQAQHRQKMEADVVQRNLRDQRLGIVFAFFITLGTLFVATLCVRWGHEIIGGFIGSSGIGSIIMAFIYGTRSGRQEREQKSNQIQQTQKQ
jgi:uncharacterized membrane protein